VHRVRLVESAVPGADAPAGASPGIDHTQAGGTPRGQLRFDFELTRDVEFR
jgi:hypothetical protein